MAIVYLITHIIFQFIKHLHNANVFIIICTLYLHTIYLFSITTFRVLFEFIYRYNLHMDLIQNFCCILLTKCLQVFTQLFFWCSKYKLTPQPFYKKLSSSM